MTLEDDLDRVERNANDEWKEAAFLALELVTGQYTEFTTDEVWEAIPEGFTTHEPKAMGPIMTRGARKGLITRTDRTRKSKRPQCNSRPVSIWKVTV